MPRPAASRSTSARSSRSPASGSSPGHSRATSTRRRPPATRSSSNGRPARVGGRRSRRSTGSPGTTCLTLGSGSSRPRCRSSIDSPRHSACPRPRPATISRPHRRCPADDGARTGRIGRGPTTGARTAGTRGSSRSRRGASGGRPPQATGSQPIGRRPITSRTNPRARNVVPRAWAKRGPTSGSGAAGGPSRSRLRTVGHGRPNTK